MHLRSGLPEMPLNMRTLQVSERGYPVPRFVEWIDGKPDFRVMDGKYLLQACEHGLCWICGVRLPRKRAFVIGPMCAVNRVSSEPPSHVECAVFSAMACPFLTMPKMRRRESGMPESVLAPAGFGIKRNPGVALVWVTRGGYRFAVPREAEGGTGFLFNVGQPLQTLWFAEGREATRAEVLESIDSGLPSLSSMATEEGPAAMTALSRMVAEAMSLVPA